MRSLVLRAIVVFGGMLFTCGFALPGFMDPGRDGTRVREPRGKVARITSDEYRLTEDVSGSGVRWLGRTVTRYDRRGLLRTVNRYTPQGRLSYREVHLYDERGRNVEILESGESGALERRRVTQWGDDGFQSGYLIYGRRGNVELRRAYSWDEGGRHAIGHALDSAGRRGQRWETRYDADRNKLSETTFSSNGTIAFRCAWTYDAQGRELTSEISDGNGAQWSRHVWVRDRLGDWTIGEDYRDGRLQGRVVTMKSYDARGNITEKIWGEVPASWDRVVTGETNKYEGWPMRRMTFRYDVFDRIVEEARHAADGMVLNRRQYQYDPYGNLAREELIVEDDDCYWVKRVTRYGKECVYEYHE